MSEVANELKTLAIARSAWLGIARRSAPEPSLARMNQLRLAERRLRSGNRWVTGPTSLMDVLDLAHDEVKNCRVLRWLLQPSARHGLGPRVLDLLVRDLNVRLGARGDDPVLFRPDDEVTVDVEVTRDRTRADLVIANATGTVVVEAKIGAGEQERQGIRLSSMWPDATYVFLTRSGRKMSTAPDDVEWIPLQWRDIRRYVEQALAEVPSDETASNVAARGAVREYLHTLRRL